MFNEFVIITELNKCVVILHRFEEAISSQPIAFAMCTDRARLCGTLLIVTGTVLVLSSTWSLGIVGTFLGNCQTSQKLNKSIDQINLNSY